MTIVVHIYPNGEFTHGVDTSHRRDRCPRPQTSASHELIPVGDTVSLHGGDINAEITKECRYAQPGDTFRNHAEECTYTYLCEDMGKHIYAIEYDYGFVCVDTLHTSLARLINKGAVAPIGLSTAPDLKKNARTRSPSKSMTKRMARRIRNTAFILQEKYGATNLSFLTLTVPSVSPEELRKIADNWGAMVHKFLVWLRYQCEKLNFPLEYVYCTEIQSKRLQQKGEYALHLHLVFRGRNGKKSPWAITPKKARTQWVRCIRAVLGHGNFCKSALENLQRVRKSAGGYLSKYMSKGTNSIPSGHEANSLPAPQINWGGYSRNLSQEVDSGLLNLRGDGKRGHIARHFLCTIADMLRRGIIAFYKEGCIELYNNGDARDSRYLKVGVGRFSLAKPREWLLEFLEGDIKNCNKNLTPNSSTS
jgi:hypothetical protein